MSTPHKPSFWNGWDFKTLVTYAMIIGGFVITQMRADVRMDESIKYLDKGQQEIKESVKSIWMKIGVMNDDLKDEQGMNKSQQKDIDKHDKKLYPN